MKMKIIPFGIALVIGASVLAGCGGADSGGNSGSAASGDASASEATVLIKFNTEGFGGQIAYDDEGKVETEGSCGIIFADTGKKLYELYDDINLYNSEENMRFYANALRWNGRTEQLTSGRGDMVKIEKDDTIMRGSGFTASGISKTFSFRGNITGTIETSDENSEEESENVE